MAIPPAFSLQHHMHSAIAVMHASRGNLFDVRKQCPSPELPIGIRTVTLTCEIARTHLGQACPIPITQLVDQCPFARMLQSSFDRTSRNITLSRLGSATSRLSFAFSASRWRIRRNSDGPTPPYFVLQLMGWTALEGVSC